MKKLFISSLILLFGFISFAQNSNELPKYYPYSSYYNYEVQWVVNSGMQALMGDISKLNTGISDFDLARLSNKDLRFLRNMVYAKYGHIFSSEDLTKYYSNFEWYKPSKKITDSDLTEDERKLIERIKLFETRNEKAKTVALPAELNGFWQRENPVVAAGYSEGFVFWNGKEARWVPSEMKNLKVFGKLKGEYKIAGNVLIFSVKQIAFVEAVPNYEEWIPGWEEYKDWGKGTEDNVVTFNKPLVFKFPISAVEEKTLQVWDYEIKEMTVTIGDNEFFLIREEPEEYQKK